jgi:hypothetical protein
MAKSAILIKNGCPLTMQKTDASRVLPRLREYLDCDGVSIEKAPISGEHDWVCFRIALKFHLQCLAYLAGHEQGGRDALDRHYGRPTEQERIESFKQSNPELA